MTPPCQPGVRSLYLFICSTQANSASQAKPHSPSRFRGEISMAYKAVSCLPYASSSRAATEAYSGAEVPRRHPVFHVASEETRAKTQMGILQGHSRRWPRSHRSFPNWATQGGHKHPSTCTYGVRVPSRFGPEPEPSGHLPAGKVGSQHLKLFGNLICRGCWLCHFPANAILQAGREP